MKPLEKRIKKITLILTHKCMLSCEYCEDSKEVRSIKEEIYMVELNDKKITIDILGEGYIEDSFLVLDRYKKIKTSCYLEKLYKKYIDNKKIFSRISQSPFVNIRERNGVVE